MTPLRRAALAAVLLVASAVPAHAQLYESVGTRAQGMAGAFVAVANDATAVWWNPAGLAAGPYFNTVIEKGQLRQPTTSPDAGPGQQDSVLGMSGAVPALGFGYYRLRISEIQPVDPTAAGQLGRQDQGVPGVVLRSLALQQIGTTIGQSVGKYVVLASTVSLLRGGVAVSSGTAAAGLLDKADDLDVSSETHPDLDLGAMVSAGHLRLGLDVKHVTKPSFGSGETAFELGRQARAGVSFSTGATGTVSALTLAFDADLTKTPTLFGDAQHIAGGGEAWFFKRMVALRGGVSRNVVGAAMTSVSGGASLSPKKGFFLDGALTMGKDETKKGWTLSARVSL